MLKKGKPRRILPLRVLVRKVSADIAEGCRAEQCIHNGVAEHVSIGMGNRPAGGGKHQARQGQRPAFFQPVHIQVLQGQIENTLELVPFSFRKSIPGRRNDFR